MSWASPAGMVTVAASPPTSTIRTASGERTRRRAPPRVKSRVRAAATARGYTVGGGGRSPPRHRQDAALVLERQAIAGDQQVDRAVGGGDVGAAAGVRGLVLVDEAAQLPGLGRVVDDGGQGGRLDPQRPRRGRRDLGAGGDRLDADPQRLALGAAPDELVPDEVPDAVEG